MPLGEAAAGMGMGSVAGDFALPDQVLAALPRDPYEQLDLARRITALAVAGRVSGLEREAGRLRAEAAEKDRESAELRERVALLDTALQETNARLRAALEDNVRCRRSGAALPAVSFSDWVPLAPRFFFDWCFFALWVQIKLSKERDSLAQTSKKLARDLQKVPSFDLSLLIHICRCSAVSVLLLARIRISHIRKLIKHGCCSS
jgi:hypothetical protein